MIPIEFRLNFHCIEKTSTAVETVKQTATSSGDSHAPPRVEEVRVNETPLASAAAPTAGVSSEAYVTQTSAQTAHGEQPITADQASPATAGKPKSNSPGPFGRIGNFFRSLFTKNSSRQGDKQRNSGTLSRKNAAAAAAANPTTTETTAAAATTTTVTANTSTVEAPNASPTP